MAPGQVLVVELLSGQHLDELRASLSKTANLIPADRRRRPHGWLAIRQHRPARPRICKP